MKIKYFLVTLKYLVCRKMCCKNFENRLTNKKVLVKTFSNRYFLYKNSHAREVKILNSHYFVMIAQNEFKMTYLRCNLHDYVFFFFFET